MKKSRCRLAAAITAVMMCAGAVSAGAQGFTEYSVNGKKVSAPMPGALKTSVEIENTENDARLITALYDSRTGALEKVAVSDKTAAGDVASTDMNIDTLDGYTLRRFVWESDGMKPLGAAQEHAIALDAQYSYGRVILTWTKVAPELKPASYSIYKDGVCIAEGISAGNASYQINDGGQGGTYRIVAVDGAGRILSASNEAAVEADLGVYYFDTENMQHVIDATPLKSKTYGSIDGQIVAGGGGTLYYDEESGSYKYTEELGDGNWGVDTIGGREAMFTTLFMQNGTASKNGCINFMLGSAFTTAYNNVKLTFDYYDEGTTDIVIRYVNGWGEVALGTRTVKRTGTNTWKTAVVELGDACFNNGSVSTGLFDGTADFRFESGGKMLHISNISIDRGDIFTGAEFDINKEYSASRTSGCLLYTSI